MSQPERVVILGGGLAGGNAALALRKAGHEGQIVLVGAESLLPYERPPMSKEYLRAEKSFEDTLVKPRDDYEQAGVELRLGVEATGLDVARRHVALGDGTQLAYDALLIATGSEPRRLDVPGGDLANVHYLRDVGDADAIRRASAAAQAIVVVGGGWIGSEVAASLRQLGRPVTLLTTRSLPLEGVLGTEVAEVYADVHQANGVRLVQGRVAELGGDGSVAEVRLEGGRRLAADMVVVGVGAIPRIGLAEAAGLELADGGIAVDEYLRTSAPGVFAVGDVAAAWNPRYGQRLRVEHWDNARRQGRTAAANIAGQRQAYERVPYLYSDQFELGMEYRGFAPRWDSVVIRGNTELREFDALWLADGRVIAAMNVNRWDDAKLLGRLVDEHVQIDPRRLADSDVALEELAGQHA